MTDAAPLWGVRRQEWPPHCFAFRDDRNAGEGLIQDHGWDRVWNRSKHLPDTESVSKPNLTPVPRRFPRQDEEACARTSAASLQWAACST